MNTLSSWLQEKIKEKGIGISKLSEETGLSRAIIYYYFKDSNRPTRVNMQKICDVLGADIEEAMALFTPKRIGRPPGSVHHWGSSPLSTEESSISPEYIEV